MQCRCIDQANLVEVGQDYTEFVSGMRHVDTGDWVQLLQCPECGQLWRVDGWDKYQTLYALRLSTPEAWREIDMKPMIKAHMVENHGGVGTSSCLANGCDELALKGRAFCVDHFYETGARD